MSNYRGTFQLQPLLVALPHLRFSMYETFVKWEGDIFLKRRTFQLQPLLVALPHLRFSMYETFVKWEGDIFL